MAERVADVELRGELRVVNLWEVDDEAALDRKDRIRVDVRAASDEGMRRERVMPIGVRNEMDVRRAIGMP